MLQRTSPIHSTFGDQFYVWSMQHPNQAVEIGKEKLREFLENSDTGRQAIGMKGREDSDSISLNTLDSRGKKDDRGG